MNQATAKPLSPLDAAGQARAAAHLPLAELLASTHFRRCGRVVPFDVLLSEAHYGLIYAASRYDESRGVPFGAFATLAIRHRLTQVATVWQRGGWRDMLTFTDVAAVRGDASRQPDPPCWRTESPEQEASNRDLLTWIHDILPPRWFTVLLLHFAHNYTLEEIGTRYGISRERVRQLLGKAIQRVRREMREEAG
jgi:RNA polymerase sigma factor (sigma-70 family)